MKCNTSPWTSETFFKSCTSLVLYVYEEGAKNSYQMYFYSVVANKATIFRFDWKWSCLRCTGTCNISHKLLRSRQFLGKFQEILEWFTLQKSQAPPLTKCCGIWEDGKSSNTEACTKKLSKIFAANIYVGEGVGLRIMRGIVVFLYRANKWTGFYMIRTSIMKELI